METDWKIVIRHALTLAKRIDVDDPENLAGDMIEENVKALKRGAINAPTRKTLLNARRRVLSSMRRRRHHDEQEIRTVCYQQRQQRDEDLAISLVKLQQLWPELTKNEREAMQKYLLSDVCYDRKRGKVLDIARRNVFAMLNGKTRDNKFILSKHF